MDRRLKLDWEIGCGSIFDFHEDPVNVKLHLSADFRDLVSYRNFIANRNIEFRVIYKSSWHTSLNKHMVTVVKKNYLATGGNCLPCHSGINKCNRQLSSFFVFVSQLPARLLAVHLCSGKPIQPHTLGANCCSLVHFFLLGLTVLLFVFTAACTGWLIYLSEKLRCRWADYLLLCAIEAPVAIHCCYPTLSCFLL